MTPLLSYPPPTEANNPPPTPAHSPTHRHNRQPAMLGTIALGGSLGGSARYGLGLMFPTPPAAFPVTTLAINVSGAFLLALLLVLVAQTWPPTRYLRPFVGVGFLGAYTTFSTWMVDSLLLMARGRPDTALVNLAVSVFTGLAATSLGLTCGRAIATARRTPGHHQRNKVGPVPNGVRRGKGGGRDNGRGGVVSKLPQITLAFWIMKIAATTLGETAGDLLAQTLNVGYLASSLILISLFLLSLLVQLRSRAFNPALYWTVILSTSTAGTTMSDFMNRTAGLGYAKGALVLISLLVAVFVVWRVSGLSFKVQNVATFRGELLYWTAILISNTLGTSLGDFLADNSGLGFSGAALLLIGLMAAIIAMMRFTTISRTLLFWTAFVLTRPLGASAGDFFSKPIAKGGLGFGTIGSSLVLVAALVALIVHSYVDRWRVARSAEVLANRGIGLGNRHNGGNTAAKAVRIFRKLAEVDPPAFECSLAMALNNRGVQLSAAGRTRQAYMATAEGVEILRRLAADDTAAVEANLATALRNLGAQLSIAGQTTQAHTATAEAVEIFRWLSMADVAVKPELATALNNYGVQLANAGRHRGALIATNEAVEIRRELARADPDVYRPDLARGLWNFVRVRVTGEVELPDALRAAEECVATYEALDRQHPHMFAGQLHSARNTLADVRNGLQRSRDEDAAHSALNGYRRDEAADPSSPSTAPVNPTFVTASGTASW
jgi:protein CrcB